MRNPFEWPAKRAVAAALTFMVSMLLVSCASARHRMTQAALTGDAAALDGLVAPGSPEINTPVTLDRAQSACPGRRTLTPLQAAACAGHETVARKLLAGKADVDLAAGAGQAPLLLAVANGHDDVARLLVQSGAKLESTDTAGNTALMLCAAKGNRSLAEFLLKNGASPAAKNGAGETAILLSSDAALSKMLAGLGADPLAVNARGESGLHMAARNGNAETARFFLERGVDAGLRNESGATALDIARGVAKADVSSEIPGGNIADLKAARVASARRRPMPSRAAAPPPESVPDNAKGRAAVAAVIEERIGRTVREETASADRVAKEGRSGEALALYAAALSKADVAGGDAGNELRVKIVRYAASLPAPPGLPEKAREHLVRSSYLLKNGRDVELVENEMTAALRAAPWWAEGYYNLGQIQAEQGKFDPAERNLRLFIAAAPGDPRAQAAQDKIYEIGMAREEKGKIRGMQGRWIDAAGRGYAVSVDGDRIAIRSDGGLVFTLGQRNGVIEGSVEGQSYPGEHRCTIPGQMHPVNGRLAPDARGISLEYLWSAYKTSYHCVNMAGVPSNCCLLCDEVCDAVTVSGTSKVAVQLKPAR